MSRNLMMERFALVGLDLSGPFTPERLLSISAQARERHEALLLEFPPGTVHDGRNAARELMQQSERAARWMQMKGMDSLMHVGSFDARTFKPGMRVRIKAGTPLRSLHPKDSGLDVVARRDRVVTLHSFNPGYIDYYAMHGDIRDTDQERFERSLRQAEVMWAGRNGFWVYADANQVELIEEAVDTKVAA